MRQYLSAHIETNNMDYGHALTNLVRLPGLEGWEIDSRLPGPDTLRIFRPYGRKLSVKFSYFPSVWTEIYS